MNDDTRKLIDFILESEKLKGVLRLNKPVGLDRYENSAEHSWQISLTALVLLDTRPELDALKVLKMLLIHDLVEIDAGDVQVYDDAARKAIEVEEKAAAVRIFGILPDAIGSELHDLWLEFEAAQTPEAKFAKAVDRVNPVLQNLTQNGQSWVENGIRRGQVLEKNQRIADANGPLWDEIEKKIKEADWF
ncbi:MAG: HD domain-containing protein [Rhizobiaceae bacterium]|nr:HD domain-containing protein [Rhizobiaceae bacterium]